MNATSPANGKDFEPLSLDDLNKARTQMGYPAMSLDGKLMSTYPDNIEQWLRRPYGQHERHFIECAATGTSLPCPCERCVAERATRKRSRLARFEAWLESLDDRAIIATLDKLSNIALIVLVIAFVAFVLGQLTMWLLKGGL